MNTREAALLLIEKPSFVEQMAIDYVKKGRPFNWPRLLDGEVLLPPIPLRKQIETLATEYVESLDVLVGVIDGDEETLFLIHKSCVFRLLAFMDVIFKQREIT